MSLVLPVRSVFKSRVLLITWALALLLALYLVENLWVDRWIQARFAGLPSLVPEALTPGWFVMFGLGGIACVVMVVCLVLVARQSLVRKAFAEVEKDFLTTLRTAGLLKQ